MYDCELLAELLNKEKNQILRSVIMIPDSTEKFEKLISIRDSVDPNAYAMYVRMALQIDTHSVPLDVLLKALQGLTQEDLMSSDEITKLQNMEDMLTIYRGTDYFECPPRLSWSLLYDKARDFSHGKMFKTSINKHDIIAYFCCNGDEEEIIAHVTDNYECI